MAHIRAPLPTSQFSPSSETGDWTTIRRVFQRFTTPVSAVPILHACVPELATVSFETSSCAILDARLKTYLKSTSKGQSTLSVCYRLTQTDRSTGSSFQRILYVKVFLGGRSAEAFHLLVQKTVSGEESHDAVIHVPEHDLVVWRFPHDPALPHLRHITDLPTIEQTLPLEGLKQIGLQRAPQVLARCLVNYRPEIRCTNRYDLHDPPRARTEQLFGKTFRGAEGQILHDRLQFLWSQYLSDPNAMRIAQPLGYSPAINTVWQRGVPGTPLRQVLDESTYEHFIRTIVNGLTSLHTSNISGLAAHSVADHLTEVRKKLAKLSDALPHLKETCESLAALLHHSAPRPSDIPCCPIHWDFHVDQLVADNGDLIFCDLDELVLGDPVQDLANFVVDLHFRNLDCRFVRFVSEKLYQDYRTTAPWDVPIERVAWHTRLQLINKAYRNYLRFAPHFEQTVEQILSMAEEGLTI